MCLQVLTCNFTQASNNEQLLLDEGCWRLSASHLPAFSSLSDGVISFHSGFSIVHQYIQHFNEVSGNKSGKIQQWWMNSVSSVIMLKLNKNEHFQPTAGYY